MQAEASKAGANQRLPVNGSRVRGESRAAQAPRREDQEDRSMSPTRFSVQALVTGEQRWVIRASPIANSKELLIQKVKESELLIRGFYDQYIDLDGDTIALIFVIDGLFLFDHLNNRFYDQYIDLDGDTIALIFVIDGLFLFDHLNNLYSYKNPKSGLIGEAERKLSQDIMKLENQIPLFLLLKLIGKFLRQYSGENYANPKICFFHVLFKASALAFYILSALFFDTFVIIFVVTVLLAALDFWVVKNVSGRILVGLRWWNEINDEGESVWKFECLDQESLARMNKKDSWLFWWTIYLTAVLWLVLGIFSLIRFQADYLLIVGVCLTLSIANIVGFTKCRKDAKKQIQEFASQTIASRFSSTLQSAFTLV